MRQIKYSFGMLALLLIVIAASCLPKEQPAATTAPAGKIPTIAVPQPPAAQAWQQQWNDKLAAAKKEGKVVIYSSANPQTRTALAGAFKDKYGIEVQFVTGIGAEIVTRFVTEWRTGIRLADLIIIGAPDLLNQVKPLGSLENLKTKLILPEVAENKGWRWEKVPFIDKDSRVLAFLAGYSTVIAVNTDLVKDGQVKSYFDLLAPEWKGKILLSDPTVPGTSNEWVAFMLLNALGMEKGKEYMSQFVKQAPVLMRDTRLTVDWVSRGKNPLVVGPHRQAVAEFQNAGAPIKWLRLAEGGLISPAGGCVSLPLEGSNPNSAVVFLNWLLTQEGQTVFYKNYGTPSARSDVSTEGLDPASIPVPGEKVFIPDEEWWSARAKLPPLIREIFGSLMQ